MWTITLGYYKQTPPWHWELIFHWLANEEDDSLDDECSEEDCEDAKCSHMDLNLSYFELVGDNYVPKQPIHVVHIVNAASTHFSPVIFDYRTPPIVSERVQQSTILGRFYDRSLSPILEICSDVEVDGIVGNCQTWVWKAIGAIAGDTIELDYYDTLLEIRELELEDAHDAQEGIGAAEYNETVEVVFSVEGASTEEAEEDNSEEDEGDDCEEEDEEEDEDGEDSEAQSDSDNDDETARWTQAMSSR